MMKLFQKQIVDIYGNEDQDRWVNDQKGLVLPFYRLTTEDYDSRVVFPDNQFASSLEGFVEEAYELY